MHGNVSYSTICLNKQKTILIHAGAGGVGHVAIQLAKRSGARVLTTAHGEEKHNLVKRLGADEVIHYRVENFVDKVNQLTQGTGVDVVFDTVGGETFKQSLDCLTYRGSIVTLLEPGSDTIWKEARVRNIKVIFELMLTPMVRGLTEARQHQVDILNQCAALIDAGELELLQTKTFPLAEAANAHATIEDGHTLGKIALEI